MNTIELLLQAPSHTPHGRRQHRFMESADVLAAFRAVFRPLRSNIRRGMTIEGQLYGLEADPCIPGELLGASWLPPASHGLRQGRELADPARRRAVFARLLSQRRPESLFAYVCEQHGDALYVEIVSADGCHGASFPIVEGHGWHVRELLPAPHFRIGDTPLAR